MEDNFKTGSVRNFTALRVDRKATRTDYMDTLKGKENEVGMVTTIYM